MNNNNERHSAVSGHPQLTHVELSGCRRNAKPERMSSIGGLVSGYTKRSMHGMPPYRGEEPEVWFHDFFGKDGSVYIKNEVDLIKRLTLGN